MSDTTAPPATSAGLRITIVMQGSRVRKGGKDLENRSILAIQADDIEAVWGEPEVVGVGEDFTRLRTRSGAEFLVPQNFEQFLCWMSAEIDRQENRQEKRR